MDNKFRSAAFGGFNRQDVMDYLERTVKENTAARAELEQQIADLRARNQQLESRAAEAENREQQLNRELEESKADCRAAQARSELYAQAQEEVEQMRSRMAQLEADAAAYVAIKERTASIELEAHRRAQAIVDDAQEQAEQVRRELAQWLERVERDYYDLRAQVGNTVTHATSELERVRQGLDNIALCMNSQHSALERMMQNAKGDASVNKE